MEIFFYYSVFAFSRARFPQNSSMLLNRAPRLLCLRRRGMPTLSASPSIAELLRAQRQGQSKRASVLFLHARPLFQKRDSINSSKHTPTFAGHRPARSPSSLSLLVDKQDFSSPHWYELGCTQACFRLRSLLELLWQGVRKCTQVWANFGYHGTAFPVLKY